MSKKKFILACLDCGDEYKAKSEFIACPACGGVGELSVSNYDTNWGNSDSEYDNEFDGINIDNLSYDPDLYD